MRVSHGGNGMTDISGFLYFLRTCSAIITQEASSSAYIPIACAGLNGDHEPYVDLQLEHERYLTGQPGVRVV
jgi:hypothetical protein